MSSEAVYGQPEVTVEALIAAVGKGELETARALLDADPSLVVQRDLEGRNAMTTAIYAGQDAIVALLRERGATLTLFEAAALGDLEALNVALASGSSTVHSYSFDGWSALHLAAHFGRIEAAKALLAAGANVSAHSWNGMDNEPIHAAAAHKGNVAMVATLLDAGAQINARQHGGFTALHQAAQNGDDEMVTLLLSHGARKSLEDDEDQTAADLAEKAGRHDLAQRLS
jgi:ankyrin repeat protein